MALCLCVQTKKSFAMWCGWITLLSTKKKKPCKICLNLPKGTVNRATNYEQIITNCSGSGCCLESFVS